MTNLLKMNRYILTGFSAVGLYYLHDHWKSTKVRLTIKSSKCVKLPKIPFTEYQPELRYQPFSYRVTYVTYNRHHDDVFERVKDKLDYNGYPGILTFEVKPGYSFFWIREPFQGPLCEPPI